MIFKVKARVEKCVWNNQESYLYAVIETAEDKQKKWSIFTKNELANGCEYEFTGQVSNAKDKKTNQWKTNFNAETVVLSEDIPF